MAIFGESLFVHKDNNGDIFMVIEPEFALLLLQCYPNDGVKLHRTNVEDMSGDALDMVEVEMVNDGICNRAQEMLGSNNNDVLNILKDAVVNKRTYRARLDDDTIRRFLMFANLLHVSRVNVNSSDVGVAQGDEEVVNIFDVANNNDLDKLMHFVIISMINELTDLWIV